jgi:hypothetical protein
MHPHDHTLVPRGACGQRQPHTAHDPAHRGGRAVFDFDAAQPGPGSWLLRSGHLWRPGIHRNRSKIAGWRAQPEVEDFHKQFPDLVPIEATLVKSGEALAALAGNSEAYLFHCDDEISHEAKQRAARLFDYLRDLVDVWDDVSFSDRLRYTQDMEQMLSELEGLDVRVHVASRSTKVVGVHWENNTPLPLSIELHTHRAIFEVNFAGAGVASTDVV